MWERFARVGDLFARRARPRPMDLTNAFEALGVRSRTTPTARSDAPRPASRATTSEEIIAASKDPKLAEYVRKRDFEGTPEPAPGAADGAGQLVRDPQAPRDRGCTTTCGSSATARSRRGRCPKGLPTAKGDKRLAVRTEDHPLEYGQFEGTIPEGHYGAGEVRIFDDGWYEPIEWDDKKVSFRLHGRRYPGLEFHFVKTRHGLARVPRERAGPRR